MTETKELPWGHAMYLGEAPLKSGKTGAVLIWLTDLEVQESRLEGPLSLLERLESQDTKIYEMKYIRKHMRGKPGSIYKVKHDDTTISASSAGYVKMWANEDELIQLQALDESARRTREAHESEKKDKVDAGLKSLLDPLAAGYRRCIGLQRSQYLAMVVEYIVTGGKK